MKSNKQIVEAKDVVIAGTEVFEWDWAWDKNSGKSDLMHHSPGYRIKDIEHYIAESGCSKDSIDIIILSTGYRGRVKVGILPELEKLFGKTIVVGKTDETLKAYAQHSSDTGKKLLYFHHSTC